MKTKIYSSLLAVLLLNLCVNVIYAQDQIYAYVSLKTPPTYPGGMAKFYEFLGKTIQYPKAAVENNVQGTVSVSFIIEKDGTLTDLKVNSKVLGSGTEEEAIRVMKLSKPWNPGIVDDKPVRVKYNIPIKFAMPNRPKKEEASVSSQSQASTSSNTNDQDKTVYSYVTVENRPTYPGGVAKFYESLGQNINYPKTATEAKAEGIVNVNFTIEKNGTISDVIITGRKLGYGLDEEAIRVVKLSKSWNPALQNGIPVRVKYNIPVKFSMKK